MRATVEIISATECKRKGKTYKIVNLDEEKATGITIFRPIEPRVKYYSFGQLVIAKISNKDLTAIIT